MRHVVAVALLLGVAAIAAAAAADHGRFAPVLTIDPESARALLERGGVATVDLRSDADFRAGRLPGARSLPLSTLAARLDELPSAGVIILYGDGPTERVLGAYHLVTRGRAGEVYVLEGGVDAWRRLGYRLER